MELDSLYYTLRLPSAVAVGLTFYLHYLVVAQTNVGKHMIQQIINLTLSVLACLAAFLMSWPFWRSFEYWPDSQVAWWIYFAVGFMLAIYVFYVFLGSLHTLFLHDKTGHEAPADEDGMARSENDEAKLP